MNEELREEIRKIVDNYFKEKWYELQSKVYYSILLPNLKRLVSEGILELNKKEINFLIRVIVREIINEKFKDLEGFIIESLQRNRTIHRIFKEVIERKLRTLEKEIENEANFYETILYVVRTCKKVKLCNKCQRPIKEKEKYVVVGNIYFSWNLCLECAKNYLGIEEKIE